MRRALTACTLAAALALVGCGGDDGDDDDATSTTTEATTTEAEPPTDDGGDDDGGDGSTTEVPDGDDTTTTEAPTTTAGGGGGGADGAEFCAAYELLEESDDLDRPDPQTPQDYIDGFNEVLPLAQDALDVAPDEIRDDFAALVDAIEQVIDDLEGVATVEEAERLISGLDDDPELEAASDRVDDYAESTCDDGDDDGTDGPADDPATGQPPATTSVPT